MARGSLLAISLLRADEGKQLIFKYVNYIRYYKCICKLTYTRKHFGTAQSRRILYSRYLLCSSYSSGVIRDFGYICATKIVR